MTSDLTTKAAEIRAGLEGVTPGPWQVVGGSVTDMDREYPGSLSFEFMPNGEAEEGDQKANAAHFARLDPATVLAFLDERDQHLALIEQQAAELAEARADLGQIADMHIPDCPAHFTGDEAEWAQRHVATLRRIARGSGKPMEQGE